MEIQSEKSLFNHKLTGIYFLVFVLFLFSSSLTKAQEYMDLGNKTECDIAIHLITCDNNIIDTILFSNSVLNLVLSDKPHTLKCTFLPGNQSDIVIIAQYCDDEEHIIEDNDCYIDYEGILLTTNSRFWFGVW